MKKVALFLTLFFTLFVPSTYALNDPTTRPNNFHGIHILFPSELDEASALVNSSEGEWGYVTIPIQSTDRDMEMWQNFMDMCREKQLIPIIRLATEPYYKDTSVWRIPTENDIIYFANFLNSLNWPVENRYVIVYNEVNRFDEWGGESPDPDRYAEILSFAIDVFKKRNPDFYMIMAGMDNASPNDGIKYRDNMSYISEMIEKNPEAIKKLDGFSSHSYPNPGFSQPPDSEKEMGTATYKHEFELINSISDKKIPAFITETGWISDNLPSATVARYYEIAYQDIWKTDKDRIVAITPFLLNSTGGQFENFSFIVNGTRTEIFEKAQSLSKVKGEPVKNERIKGVKAEVPENMVEKKFKAIADNTKASQNLIIEYIKIFF